MPADRNFLDTDALHHQQEIKKNNKFPQHHECEITKKDNLQAQDDLGTHEV